MKVILISREVLSFTNELEKSECAVQLSFYTKGNEHVTRKCYYVNTCMTVVREISSTNRVFIAVFDLLNEDLSFCARIKQSVLVLTPCTLNQHSGQTMLDLRKQPLGVRRIRCTIYERIASPRELVACYTTHNYNAMTFNYDRYPMQHVCIEYSHSQLFASILSIPFQLKK